ncbi:response regulator transcription factor [Cellulomonas sp. zg-ZUI222]|uniref:Response regulator transcription factor n=1 Tax=Cellulomonas wangleii TaxID=2816956 RepID=A0ABX8D6S9_9CELL|nr:MULTISPECIES: response regulator transcription factor [Cellulomonas]MBO0901140.1 response regulator transcription factor [Cellulomonas sp. zg-ZUI22]MBO0922548.1 response regulator transcription factor [Cellulomonas wangleii]MBO0926747.1 response regulator transcription factor [Cellulomonas wangleii]QVI63140.1 response regulator transcription factor [Cellulomonas wangleii]
MTATAEQAGTRSERQTVRVVLVDDETLVRVGLRLILGADPAIDVVGEAGDGLEAIDVVRRTAPDVVLMDIRMPRLDGLGATERLLTEQPDSRVVILTTFDTDEMVLGALRLGAAGFLLKDTPPAEIVRHVLDAGAGRTTLSPSVTDRLIASVTQRPRDERRTAARARLDALTERERDVARAIGRGLSNAEIASELFITVATVKTHISRILEKMPADNRTHIAICVHEAGDV